jgi:DNA-3-methyladenine glycosylase
VSDRDLCNGPGKLTQALGITLADNDQPLRWVEPGEPAERILVGRRVGITKAADLPWRFAAPSAFVSRPRMPLGGPASGS